MILPMIIEPSEEIIDFFYENGHVIDIAEESTYYFLPCWIEKRKDGVHFLHQLGNLPAELTNEVRSIRGENFNGQYTKNDMIEFAKSFLSQCKKQNVTPHQLEMFNKEKGYE